MVDAPASWPSSFQRQLRGATNASNRRPPKAAATRARRQARPPRTCEQARNIHRLAEIRDAGNNMSAVAAITREHDNRLACLSLSLTGGDKIDRRAWHSATRERERAKHSSIGGDSRRDRQYGGTRGDQIARGI